MCSTIKLHIITIHDIRINKSTKTNSTKRHIEDSDYVERAKLLEEQDEFARNNLVNNLLVEYPGPHGADCSLA